MSRTDFPHTYGKPGQSPGTHREAIPFSGEVPDIVEGDPVLARDVSGKWWPKVALSGPRYDHACSIGVTYLTVPVATPEEWAVKGRRARSINWPAEDVKVASADG